MGMDNVANVRGNQLCFLWGEEKSFRLTGQLTNIFGVPFGYVILELSIYVKPLQGYLSTPGEAGLATLFVSVSRLSPFKYSY